MNVLDVFNGDGFSVAALTAAINELPYTPTRIGDLKMFAESGVSATTVIIEYVNGKLTLVPAVPRGSPPQPKTDTRGLMIPMMVPHLPQRSTVMADEVQGLRTIGSSDNVTGVTARVNKLLGIMRRDLDYTIEYHRIGAIKGLVLNADGSTMFDLYTLLGLTQDSQGFALTTSGTEVIEKVLALKAAIEEKLGGVMYDHIHVLCGTAFFAKLVTHPAVKTMYTNWKEGAFLRADNRRGFEIAGVIFEEYRGSVGATPFIGADDAYAFPVGVPDMFQTFFAPGDYVETVNTIGLPYYAKQERIEFDKGIKLEVQSNPLNVNTRPGAVIKLTKV